MRWSNFQMVRLRRKAPRCWSDLLCIQWFCDIYETLCDTVVPGMVAPDAEVLLHDYSSIVLLSSPATATACEPNWSVAVCVAEVCDARAFGRDDALLRIGPLTEKMATRSSDQRAFQLRKHGCRGIFQVGNGRSLDRAPGFISHLASMSGQLSQ